MGRSPWVLVVVALALVGCSDDSGDSSTPPAPGRATVPPPSTSPPAEPTGEACELVTRADAEVVFGVPARPGDLVGSDSTGECAWESTDGPEQLLSFQFSEGSDVATSTLSDASINVTVQRSINGRTFAFRYLADGGDADAKREAVDALADSVVAQSE